VVSRRRPDGPSLVAGLSIALLGAVLLLDHAGVLDLRFAALGPLVCAALGAILLASGLAKRD
jgi:hypothetical protein